MPLAVCRCIQMKYIKSLPNRKERRQAAFEERMRMLYEESPDGKAQLAHAEKLRQDMVAFNARRKTAMAKMDGEHG